jgi:hypothetical protein
MRKSLSAHASRNGTVAISIVARGAVGGRLGYDPDAHPRFHHPADPIEAAELNAQPQASTFARGSSRKKPL